MTVRTMQDVASRTHSAEEDGSCVVCLSNPCSAGFVHGDRCLPFPASHKHKQWTYNVSCLPLVMMHLGG